MSDKGFFERWRGGMVVYMNSAIGQSEMRIVFLCVVVFGLFAGSIERLVDGDWTMFLVLLGFGCLMSLDLKNQFKAYNKLKDVRRNY